MGRRVEGEGRRSKGREEEPSALEKVVETEMNRRDVPLLGHHSTQNLAGVVVGNGTIQTDLFLSHRSRRAQQESPQGGRCPGFLDVLRLLLQTFAPLAPSETLVVTLY